MPKDQTATTPSVSAGTAVKTITVKNKDGTVLVAKPWKLLKADVEVKLEGNADLLDLTAKANITSKLRLEDTDTAHPEILFQGREGWTQKKGGILFCETDGCVEVFARWTSDMHQATLCDRCRVKRRRANAKAKRQAGKAAK